MSQNTLDVFDFHLLPHSACKTSVGVLPLLPCTRFPDVHVNNKKNPDSILSFLFFFFPFS